MTVRNDKFSKASLPLYACGTIPVIWIALLLAPYVDGGLVALIRYGGAALNDPFHMEPGREKDGHFCRHSRQ
mgnify:CR=1 FL=1